MNISERQANSQETSEVKLAEFAKRNKQQLANNQHEVKEHYRKEKSEGLEQPNT